MGRCHASSSAPQPPPTASAHGVDPSVGINTGDAALLPEDILLAGHGEGGRSGGGEWEGLEERLLTTSRRVAHYTEVILLFVARSLGLKMMQAAVRGYAPPHERSHHFESFVSIAHAE